MCFSRSASSSGTGSPDRRFGLGQFAIENADGHHQVADQLAFVGVGEFAVVGKLVDLADVVQEGPHQQQVAVEGRIEPIEPANQVHQSDDVLQQTAQIGVMVFHAGRCLAELAHERSSTRKHSPSVCR